ncbi:hypothetical protein [uncultured Ilyobacter sp.]|uniref:hypothetical protein n=1 Tax=uncultured Ilyobacter sp. TaxID=544433 RepID=UPI0029C01F8B|nr:hypothetical protein [uncultured Ilyobacter sp.]
MDITKTVKYRKAKHEYQRLLSKALKEQGISTRDLEEYEHYIADIVRSKRLSKSGIAKKYRVTPQRLQNWIQRHRWNDLSGYVDVPEIILNMESPAKSNSPYGPKMLAELGMYSKQLKLNGERKYSNKELAELLLISESTFYKYIKRPEFNEILNKSRSEALRKWKYERALDKRAFGYEASEASEEDVFSYGKKVGRKRKDSVKHIPGDVNAIKFGLKNIAPDEYKDRQEVKQEIKGDHKIDLSKMNDEELEALLNGGTK